MAYRSRRLKAEVGVLGTPASRLWRLWSMRTPVLPGLLGKGGGGVGQLSRSWVGVRQGSRASERLRS